MPTKYAKNVGATTESQLFFTCSGKECTMDRYSIEYSACEIVRERERERERGRYFCTISFVTSIIFIKEI